MIKYRLLQKQYFKDHFSDLDNSHQNWIRDPFGPGVGASLDLMSPEKLIDMSNNLKEKFDAPSLPQYWLYVRKDYPGLAERAVKSLLPFGTTYLCKSGFSTLQPLKKHRACLQVKKRYSSGTDKP